MLANPSPANPRGLLVLKVSIRFVLLALIEGPLGHFWLHTTAVKYITAL